ncbi:IS66 family insertion sequence element accessory protein TnpA [Chromatocurvus halotolerans]|uniref:Transposase n=1 Tax=Chromatocurvus halotolerans TaxID=1132028 RepID=A0A4R2KAQ8_9GAMM|nr:transposase [Chromatocurvus halotolerans]TCO69272.1 transposase [Chromatocurvus halotolerans]
MTSSMQDSLSHALPAAKPRTQRSRAQKKALVEQFHASGLTRAAFCKQHGIATSCLSRWQKALSPEASANGFIDITQSVSAAALPRPAAKECPRWQVELELGAGVVLRVRTG